MGTTHNIKTALGWGSDNYQCDHKYLFPPIVEDHMTLMGGVQMASLW